MWDRIAKTLEILGLLQYKDKFIEQELDDALIEECISDGNIDSVLNDVMPVIGHRLKFKKKFVSVPVPSEDGSIVTEVISPIKVAILDESLQGSSCETENWKEDDAAFAEQKFQHPAEPKPLQIMNFRQRQQPGAPAGVWCYEQAFASILKKTGNRRVAVLAIAGPTRKGKSVFMNFVLRRLNGLINDEIDWMGWARNMEPLTGFSWEASDERVTTGIWMWSEPFTLKSKDGSEFDILLMDTQGVFDERSGPREWAILMGLSLLTSSCLLFNIVNNIEEKDLLLLDEFLSFGLMALEDKDKNNSNIAIAESHKAFQKLVFLIRDWNNPGMFPYGSVGGQKFIEKKLEIKDFHQEGHKAVREKLKKCFEEISCFLLPHPGNDAIQLNFNGSIVSCATFAAEVEKSITELLDMNDIPTKSLNRNFLTGQDLLALFKLYVDLFNTDRLSSKAIYDVTSQGCNSAVVNKCVSFCIGEIEKSMKGMLFVLDTLFDSYCKSAMEKSLTLFTNSPKMGSKELIAQSKNDLIEQLETICAGKISQNLELRAKAIDRAYKDAVLKYCEIMDEFLAAAIEFAEEEKLEQASELAENRSLQLFHSLLQLKNNDDLMEEKDQVRTSIKIKLHDYINFNAEKREQAEKMLEEEVYKFVEQYSDEMNSKFNGKILSSEELKDIHDIVSSKCLDNFARIHSTSLLYEQGRESLTNRIWKELDDLQKVMKNTYDSINEEGEALVTEALAHYRAEMINAIGIDDEEFEQSHRLIKSSAIEIIRNSEIPTGKIMDKFVNKLESKVHEIHVELLLKLHENKTKIKNQMMEARENARNGYEEAMQAFFNQREDPISELKLEARHNHERSQASNSLKRFFEEINCILKDANDQEVIGLAELAESIKHIYVKLQETNKLRWKAFEAKAYNYLSDAKSEYAKRIKIAIDDTFDVEDLNEKEVVIRLEAMNFLLDKLDPDVAKPEFIKKLGEELTEYMVEHFEESFEVFQLRLEEDEVAVKAALDEARKYYNDEMDKRFKTKDWYEEDELSDLNEQLLATAIEKCKDEVLLNENQEKQLLEAMKIVYLKYKEENIRRHPVDNPSIGIDLGTTYSCVGVYVNGEVKIITNKEINESPTTPSYVAFNEDRTIAVGEAAKNLAYRNPVNTIFDAKRLIGRAYSDPIVQEDIKLWPFNVVSDNDKPIIRVVSTTSGSKTFRPEEISAKVLVKMKNVAETYLKKTVKQAVVTVPAYFNDAQRQATRDAAEIAGLKVRILNEPTAAAIAYKLHRTDELKRNVLIFDLGGGTFDVAVLEMKGGEIKVKSTGGDTHLGGEDFDNAMVKSLIERVKRKHGRDLARGSNCSDPIQKSAASGRLRRMRDQCEKAKRNLSSTPSTTVLIEMIDDHFTLKETFTRGEFEQLNMALFTKCIDIVKEALEDAKLDKTEIDDIVLVGGSTRIPKVQELLKNFFDGKKELNSTINADEAVARGAAIQAALLNGEQVTRVGHGVTLTDVAPLSLGIEIVTGEMSKVIHKNSPVPCEHAEVFRTVVNNQTTVNFKVYEGENPIAVDNNFLGKFLLTGIPSAPAGREPLDCKMTIDSEGILHVQAVSRNNGNFSDITIETYNGRMTQEEIVVAQLAEHFRW